jgi:glycosyltransferase involved in cell wall biosynthesis
MKLLVLSYEYPPIGGGGGIICKNVSENLARLGNQVTVLTTAFHSETDNKLKVPENTAVINLKVIRLDALRKKSFESNPAEMLSWIATTKKYIKSNPGFIDFDRCMAHFVLPGGEVARWLKREYGLPYVLVSHGHEIPWIHPRQMFLLHLAAYSWIKKVCMESALVFVQTQMMKANLDRFMGENQAHKHVIIPNGVDTTRFYPDYSKRSQKLRIIFGGRLVLQKDPMTFLRAIKLFCIHTRDFEVHIPGDGTMRNKMERFVKKNGLTVNVKFIGRVSSEQMLEEYQSAHVMVAPSLNEGMSISALEAIACGVYLIATPVSGSAEMIEKNVNGNLVSFRNPKSIQTAIIDFLKTKTDERSVISVRFLKDFRFRFNWEDIAGQYQNYFENFLR